MKSCRVKKPRLAPLDVKVLGTIGATPVPSHERTWSPLKYPRSARAVTCSQPVACCELERHGRKLMAIVTLIGHLVGHDQMMLRIDGDLYIVAHSRGAFAAGRHRSGVGIGHRDLLVGRVMNRLLHRLQGLHLS